MAAPRILVSWYTRPRYIAPFQLSERQVTVGPAYGDPGEGEVFRAFTPFQEPYDLGAFVEREGIGTSFDAVVVWADASGNNMPMGLDAFRCPKVLCVGDTHHMESPLRTMVGYAKQAGYDYIVSSHNRHHLHWFVSAGFANVAWIPGLKARHLPQAPQPRLSGIGFVGNAADTHPLRRTLLDALRDAGLHLAVGTASREEAARLYAQALLGFNSSLNGDLNLRIFEILSGGACLLTDRLAPQSGLSLILEEDRHFIGYDGPEELVDKARFHLAHPDAALAIGTAGAARYEADVSPARQRDRLLDWVLRGRLEPRFGSAWDGRTALATCDAAALKDRIACYEALQEAHRVRPRIRVLFLPGVPACHVADAADLHRADLAMLRAGDAEPAALAQARECTVGKLIECLDNGAAYKRAWDFVVGRTADAASVDARAFPGARILTV